MKTDELFPPICFLLFFCFLLAMMSSPLAAQSSVADSATVDKIATGFQFTEGPCWRSEGYLVFSDIQGNTVYKWSTEGGAKLFLNPSGNSNGLAEDNEGRLLLAQHGLRRIARLEADNTETALATHFDGKRLNSPNDIVVKSDGSIYFTDPPYGIHSSEEELGFYGVYRLSSDGENLDLLVDSLYRPNGLAFSPDEKKLYVNDTDDRRILEFNVETDGSLSNGTVKIDNLEGKPDGLKVGSDGHLFVACSDAGVHVFSPEGVFVTEILVPERTRNLAWGDPDRKTLFITAGISVYRLRINLDRNYSMLKIPDTGQTGDYTDIFGEDSDYNINPPTYTDNGDGTITDNITGFMWQQTDGGEMTWESAQAYADTLKLAGFDDWRLPSSHELFYLLDHGAHNPAMNTAYFINSEAEYWWSSATRAYDETRVWSANAGGGIGAHPKNETVSAGGSKRFHTRCVRDEVWTSVPDNQLTTNDDGTVADSLTGLVWQQKAFETPMTWEQALRYCENLALNDKKDWRLPNIKELRSISDDRLEKPSINRTYFPDASSEKYWSSTTEINQIGRAWIVDFKYGLVSYGVKYEKYYVRAVRGGMDVSSTGVAMELIPGGEFEMGDHHDLGGAEHRNDEIPVHQVYIDSFYIGKYEITNQQYCDYLNSALARELIEVRDGYVYGAGDADIFCQTSSAVDYSGIGWNGSAFTVLDNRDNHPMVGVRWHGAVAYSNWLSVENGLQPCFDMTTWECNFDNNGFRLPTEAEWEYAGRGGLYDPYRIFPWGDDENEDGSLANWPNSGDPYEAGSLPLTTPVGFYNGELHQKSDFGWPGSNETYQTFDGSNAYGLYDMSGNVWEWVHDWYESDYYNTSPYDNPTGPSSGKPMPDGKPYRVLRGGNWYNGQRYWGHSRVSNRNPSYYRGPDDPNHAWYHIGFRIVRNVDELKTGINKTESDIPGQFILHQNYPNPFNPATNIRYQLPLCCEVQVTILNLMGQEVITLVNELKPAGAHEVVWDGRDNSGGNMSSGIYFYRLRSNGRILIKKMTLIR